MLQNGNIVEFDAPKNLLAKNFVDDETAVFAKMYHDAIHGFHSADHDCTSIKP